jgi:hypothetical protein
MADTEPAGETGEAVLVLSFNILFGGIEYGPQERVPEVILASRATVVCLQEPHSRGWWYVEPHCVQTRVTSTRTIACIHQPCRILCKL